MATGPGEAYGRLVVTLVVLIAALLLAHRLLPVKPLAADRGRDIG